MAGSFRTIPSAVACRLRLVMTDVDGTLTLDGEHFEPKVAEVMARLQGDDIVVGLVSGRTLPRLDAIASFLGTKGPLIAENGGVARLTPNGPLVGLGYSRQPALDAVARLKSVFPGTIVELEDNRDRFVDVTISCDRVTVEELKKHVRGIQFLDSGYMIHLMAEGVSKGRTLTSLLGKIGDCLLVPDEVMVFGDSTTDISLFRSFPNSVLIHNPRLSSEQRSVVKGFAAYQSQLVVEDGFVEVASYILQARRLSVLKGD